MSGVIPVEAVEAAARVLHAQESLQDDVGDFSVEVYEHDMRAILEAAAPHMFAQALDDAVRAFPLETIVAPDNAVVWMMRRAEDIRGRNEAHED